jgi:glycosyltransferase involved in cell wall biosynthesis
MINRTAIFICGREFSYARNRVIYESLAACNLTLIACVSDKKTYLRRHLDVLRQFFRNRRRQHDFIFIGFLGQLLIFFIKFLSRKPVILDAFISIHETLVDDRKKVKNRFLSKIIYCVEKKSCELASLITLDTDTNIRYFVEKFHLPPDKFRRIWVGCDTEIFQPREKKSAKEFVVVFVGTYLPVQGIEYIIQAAKILESQEDIVFNMIGSGAKFNEHYQLVKQLRLENMRFFDFMPERDLPEHIARADVGLGIFGSSEKADRSIPNKVFQLLAMQKPVITIECPAVKELLSHKKSVYLCKKADPDSLAEAILTLKNNEELRSLIAKEGYNIFIQNCTKQSISADLEDVIEVMYRTCPRL